MSQLSEIVPYFVLFATTFSLVALLIPLLSKLAIRVSLVDNPDKHRKLHEKPIPLIGGVAILLGVMISCGILLLLFTDWFFPSSLDWAKQLQLIGLVVASIVIVTVGVIDDRFGVRGRQKLAAQIAAAAILVGTGTWIHSVQMPGGGYQFQDAWQPAAVARLNESTTQVDQATDAQLLSIESDLQQGVISSAQASQQKRQLAAQSEDHKNAYFSHFIFGRVLAVAGALVTLLWIVGAINSVNLIDGADGLAGTTTFIVSAALAVVAIYSGDWMEAAIAVSLSAAILGFLVFNFPPAKIFLGDAGSMLIGMVLASLAVQSFLKEAMIYICIAPLAMLFIPIFDTVTAFVRRLTTGRSIYSTDRGHLHHILMRTGLSNRGMVFFVGGLTLVTAIGGVLTVVNDNPIFSIFGVTTVFVFLVSARVFAFAELSLLARRLLRFTRSLLFSRRHQKNPQSLIVQIQGSKEWHKLWEGITEFGERHKFHRIKLDLNLPWLHESFHADWSLPAKAETEEVWQTRLPLAAKGRVYGRMEISGSITHESIYLILMLMSDLLETLEPALERLAEAPGDSIDVPEMKSRHDKTSQEEPATEPMDDDLEAGELVVAGNRPAAG